MKPFPFIIAIFCSISQLSSQPLTVGDKLPHLKLSICCHPDQREGPKRSEGPNNRSEGPSSHLSLFTSGLPTLISFFDTHCMACIREMPLLDSLQIKCKDKLQVLLVTDVPLEKLQPFVRNNKIARSISIPFISDSLLRVLFPYRLVPHMVWLSATGVVVAVTGAKEITAGNIDRFLEGNAIDLPVKQDVSFDPSLLLFQNGNGGDESSLLFRSSFTGYMPGLVSGSGISYSADSSSKRIYIFNQSPLSLYRHVIPASLQSRFIIDTAALFTIDRQPGQSEGSSFTSLYCYELVLPASVSKEFVRSFMLQDFNRYLGWYGRVEKRKGNCLALVRTVFNDSLLLSKGGKPNHALNKKDELKFIRNQSFSYLVTALNRDGCSAVPVIDETNFPLPVDIQLPVDDICNLPALRKALAPYGLDLITVQRELDFFVLTKY
jgi:hypothetical protein